MKNKSSEIIIFVDHIGRTVIGKLISTNDNALTVLRPHLVDLVPVNPQSPNGQFSVQLIPYIFSEFVHQEDRETACMSFKNYVLMESTKGSLRLDTRIHNQYLGLIGEMEANQPPPGAEGEPKTVKLFDE